MYACMWPRHVSSPRLVSPPRGLKVEYSSPHTIPRYWANLVESIPTSAVDGILERPSIGGVEALDTSYDDVCNSSISFRIMID